MRIVVTVSQGVLTGVFVRKGDVIPEVMLVDYDTDGVAEGLVEIEPGERAQVMSFWAGENSELVDHVFSLAEEKD